MENVKNPTFGENVKTTALWWVIDLLWVAVIILFLNSLFGEEALSSVLDHPFIGFDFFNQTLIPELNNKLGFQMDLDGGGLLIFFFACILAPIWENAVFFNFVIRKLQRKFHLDKMRMDADLSSPAYAALNPAEKYQIKEDAEALNKRYLWAAIIVNCAIFGLVHGSVLNILIQGVGGLIMCQVFLKTNSYWWSVILHAFWNFMLIFVLPFFMSYLH